VDIRNVNVLSIPKKQVFENVNVGQT